MITLVNDYIIQKVEELVSKYGTRDPLELCECLGIKIHYYDMKKKVKGFFFYHSRQKNIAVDCNLNDILLKIIVAHELGHGVLHKDIAMMKGFQELELLDYRTTQPLENEANLFAAELLLEDEKVLGRLSEESFFEAARSLFVPAALLDYKFILLRHKGYRLTPMEIHKSDFLKNDLGAYDEIQSDVF